MGCIAVNRTGLAIRAHLTRRANMSRTSRAGCYCTAAARARRDCAAVNRARRAIRAYLTRLSRLANMIRTHLTRLWRSRLADVIRAHLTRLRKRANVSRAGLTRRDCTAAGRARRDCTAVNRTQRARYSETQRAGLARIRRTHMIRAHLTRRNIHQIAVNRARRTSQARHAGMRNPVAHRTLEGFAETIRARPAAAAADGNCLLCGVV
jgi:hypothetical protein